MGQYHIIVNLDKREYLHPHKLGDGLKLMEFGRSGMGTMTCLAILLADSNGRGNGDCRACSPLIGSWAGDRIVITGDYGDDGQFYGLDLSDAFDDEIDLARTNLYSVARARFTDISMQIREVVEGDTPLRRAAF